MNATEEEITAMCVELGWNPNCKLDRVMARDLLAKEG